MKRHYFVSQFLQDVEKVETDLLEGGIPAHQIHVLSNHEAELEIHHLHPVADVMKTDVIRMGIQGLLIGALVAILILSLSAVMGWSQQIGWVPFVFLAIVAVGFCTWEGGFLGFQQRNREFNRFQMDLHNDKHVLFVDVDQYQEQALRSVVESYPRLLPAGSGKAAPGWIISGQKMFKDFVRWAP